MNRLGEFIFNAIYPPKCLICSEFGSYACGYCCGKHIIIKDIQRCFQCGKYSSGGETCLNCTRRIFPDRVIVTHKHTVLTSKLIYELKYNFHSYFAEFIAINMLENNSLRELLHSNTIITCVPIHISRKRWRGFNQSELLAKEIAKQKNLEFLQLLKKGTNTLPQVGLNKKQREANLKNTFEFNYTKVTKTNQIVLVDDIITTGTTLIECTRTLRNAGFKGQISAVTFTRGT